jgi:hypothetical protein
MLTTIVAVLMNAYAWIGMLLTVKVVVVAEVNATGLAAYVAAATVVVASPVAIGTLWLSRMVYVT